jgi:hypothetical protein
MRAWDLAVFVIFLEMSIGFVTVLGQPEYGQMGLFPNPGNNYFKADQGGYVKQFQQNVNGSGINNDTGAIGTIPKADILTFGMDFILAGFSTLMMIAGAFVAISWILYSQFHLDPKLCVFIQGIVYIIYLWAFVQWKSGRGGRMYE